METATAESFSSNQNGATSYRPINNFDHDVDEDFGPETNVDNIDDLMSQPVPTKKSFLDSDTIKTNFAEQLQNDVLDQHVDAESKNGALEDPVKEIIDNGKPALDEDSEEEEDEDEGWDYFKADASSKSTNMSQQQLESSSDLSNEMEHTLNPEAQEFVPVSPTKDTEDDFRSESPELCLRYPMKNTQELLKEEFIASSPMKGQEKNMDDVIVPSMNDFAQEIKKRPSNIMPRFDEDGLSSNNVANHETNNGTALPEESFEHDSTYTSTRAVFGDESYSKNLDDVNEELIEKREKSDDAAAFNGGDAEAAKNTSTADTTAAENHDQPRQHHADDFVSGDSSTGDAFESEDYPSIVEKEQISPIKEHPHHFGPDGDIFENGTSNITYGRDSGKYDAEKEVPKFDELLSSTMENNESVPAANHSDVFDCLSYNKDPVDEVIQKMSNFDCATTDDRSWLTGDSSQEVTSPTQDLFNGANPFATSSHREEKENAEEKEVAEPKADHTKYDAFDAFNTNASNDHVDFQSNVARDPFQSIFSDASAPPYDKQPVEETITAENVHDVETKPAVEATEAPNNDISAQILDMQEYGDQLHRIEDTELVPTTTANQVPAGGRETPVGSIDMVTPYIHDCSRLDEKPDSIHEHVHKKHYEDLLPDDEEQNQDATKESDKLESELRESGSGKRLEFDLGFHDGAAAAACDRTFDNDAGDEFQSLMCNLVTSKTTPSAPLADDKIVEETPSMEAAAADAEDHQPAVPVSSTDNELTATTTTDDKPVDGGLLTPPPTATLSGDSEVQVSIAEAVDKLQDEQKSHDDDNGTATATAAAVALGAATAGVAAAAAVAAAKKEPSKKPYVIRKPDPNKPAAPKAPAAKAPATKSTTTTSSKPTTRSSLGSTTTTPKKPTLSSTSSNKTATTPTKSATSSTRAAATGAAKPSAPRTSLTSKTSSTTLPSKPSPRPAAAKSLTSPSKPTKPLVGSATSPRTAAAKPITNGDVSSSTAARTVTSTTRKPLSATAPAKKITSPTSSAPTTKPAVNLATRTSLAPKPKTTITASSLADKKPIAKRPMSATSSLAASRTTTTTNKDSKDITNKRLSRPATAAATKSISKTESKVNTGLTKTTANAKKVASTDQTTNNQIDSTKMNGNA